MALSKTLHDQKMSILTVLGYYLPTDWSVAPWEGNVDMTVIFG